MKIKSDEVFNAVEEIMDVVKRLISVVKGSPVSASLIQNGYQFTGKNGRKFSFTVTKCHPSNGEYYVGSVRDVTGESLFELVRYPKGNDHNYLDDSDKFYAQPIIKFLKGCFLSLNS